MMDKQDQPDAYKVFWDHMSVIEEQAVKDGLVSLGLGDQIQTQHNNFAKIGLMANVPEMVLRTDDPRLLAKLGSREAGDSASLPIEIESDTESESDNDSAYIPAKCTSLGQRGTTSCSSPDAVPLPERSPIHDALSAQLQTDEDTILGKVQSQKEILRRSTPPAPLKSNTFDSVDRYQKLSRPESSEIHPTALVKDQLRAKPRITEQRHVAYDSYRPGRSHSPHRPERYRDGMNTLRSSSLPQHPHHRPPRRLVGASDHRAMNNFDRLRDMRNACPWDLAGQACPRRAGCPSTPICRDYQLDYAVRTSSGMGGREYMNCGIATCRRLHVRHTCPQLLEQGHARCHSGPRNGQNRCRRGAHDESRERLRSWLDRELHARR